MAVAVLTVAATVSCSIDGHYGNGDDNYFSSFASFRGAQWSYDNPRTFVVDTIADTVSQRGDIVLSVRHTNGYLFSNIWLEFVCDLADSTAVPDTFNIRLADVYGHWLGNGMGTSFRLNDTIARDVTLRRHQQLRLRHIMRVDTLDGIEQVGISFLPHNKQI